MGFIVSIDGPSGAGKGYLANALSKRFNLLYIDTGAMYRAFGLYVKNNSVDMTNDEKIKEALKQVVLEFRKVKTKTYEVVHIFLNGEDVESKIRTEEAGMIASIVSANILVRQDMIKRQRDFGKHFDVIMEGRDIGSVVFKDANVKIFLTADIEKRARRRYLDLIGKNVNIDYEKVLSNIKRRDEADINKKISPLIKTEDMIEIDNTNLDKQSVVEVVSQIIQERM